MPVRPRLASVLPLALAFVTAPLAGQTPADTWTFHGRVVAAENGKPVAGCTVTVTGNQATGYPLHWSWMDWEDPAPVVTGADGKFTFTLPAQPSRGFSDGYPSRLEVVMTADARCEQFGNFELSRFFAGPVQDAGDIVLVAGRPIVVAVVDTNGAPQEGLGVAVVRERTDASVPGWSWPSGYETARTAADGRAEFVAPIAFARHRVEVRGRKMVGGDRVVVARESTAEFKVRVETAGRVKASGRVVDETGAAVAGIRLRMVTQRDGNDVGGAAVSGVDGRFEFGATATGLADRLAIGVESDDSDRSTPWNAAWGDGDITLEVPRRVRARFRVVSPAGTRPDRVAVHMISTGRGAKETFRRIVPCVDGIATIEHAAHGEYSVRVHALRNGSWPSAWQDCVVDGSGPIEIRLPELVAQPVLVFTDEGRPVDGATVELVLGAEPDVRGGLDGSFFDHPCYGYAMTGDSKREDEPIARIAAPVRTDRAGRAVVRAIAHEARATVRVRGPFVVTRMLEWNDFAGSSTPREIRVREAGVVVLELADPALRIARDVAGEKERADAAEAGTGFDPWGRSLGPLLQQTATGLLLRPTGAGGEHFVPLADVAKLRVDSVTPGAYDVCLLVRERRDGNVVSDVAEPPLARVHVEAGVVKTTNVTLQDAHRARLR